MADVTLGDYAGYIYLEMIKAREMADDYALAVAKRYAADEALKHLSVPRFKIPKMELTVPVLVAGASYRRTVRFNASVEELQRFAADELAELVRIMQLRRRDLFVPDPAAGADSLRLVAELHVEVASNPDPNRLESILALRWPVVLDNAMSERQLREVYRELDREASLTRDSTARLRSYIEDHLVVDRTELQSLLVNPETNTVKNGSSDSSVFTLKAEIIEEGFFLREVIDPVSGEPRPVVEFD